VGAAGAADGEAGRGELAKASRRELTRASWQGTFPLSTLSYYYEQECDIMENDIAEGDRK
jgi:hypothetical protein